jgi:hypothetical protein
MDLEEGLRRTIESFRESLYSPADAVRSSPS